MTYSRMAITSPKCNCLSYLGLQAFSKESNPMTKTAGKKDTAMIKATSYRDVAERFGVSYGTVRQEWSRASTGMPRLPASFKALDSWYLVYKKGHSNKNGEAD